MRAETWICDRCRTDVRLPVRGWWGDSPQYGHPAGWRSHPTFDDIGATVVVEDVCPRCVTDLEEAQRVVDEIAVDILFEPGTAA